ncbi:hypothetical protein CGMCC3_g17909 [Colletotrichum fructicola]|nr:uncharacterized protein CGMCC3_g17909 [Colletotrichum fructicola]KAE9565913.1 hypothetical protein CGMCC3_g17909 [Colletotrichum fructicola]
MQRASTIGNRISYRPASYSHVNISCELLTSFPRAAWTRSILSTIADPQRLYTSYYSLLWSTNIHHALSFRHFSPIWERGRSEPSASQRIAPKNKEVGGLQPAGDVAALAVLLSRLPALETLEIRTFDRAEDEEDDEQPGSPAPGDPVISLLCRQMLSAEATAFAHVRTARIFVPNPDDDPAAEFGFYISMDTILPLFCLPRVQALELHRVEDGGRQVSWPTQGGPVSATLLKELVMSRAQLSEANMDRLIRACPNLEVLRWEHVIDAEYARSWLDLDALRASLETLKHSLEYLSFSVTLWTSTAIDCGERGPWGIRGTLASLRGFVRLKRVTISLPVLLGWRTGNSARLADVLPASIERVTITNELFFWWHCRWDDSKWEADGPSVPRWHTLEAKILEYLETRPPNLKQLKVEVWTAGEESRAEELRDRLISAGRVTGVHITIELRS